jgi:hypothetical protein
MAVTYNSVIQKLNAFSLANAADRNTAETKVEEFMNEIRPEIDQVLRENPNLSAEQKRAIDEKEAAVHQQLTQQFPVAGGRRLRKKSRAARLRKAKQRKTRSARRKATRKN